ncbi:FCD domain-containing protein [Gilvimarinus sp. 2_MG-2023]|uniref:FCD domain-containing protein n=1 Tax=Gilvimarinus sp. 2_MG-2023 TaxID=3062666 RepID=UPI0026E16091|nr:FCD domain-containing protein [Gilvimarinus sp. 2_MG-2023]MDO6569729.1 FCD domain-containing protein [Gilvimarinus sp. 2_MG-2023]
MSLAFELDVSRTTIRTVIEGLEKKGIIKRDSQGKRVVRAPQKQDYYDISSAASSKEEEVQRYFLSMINSGKLLPGDRFSELELAKQSGCNTVTVREFLVKFSRFGLIEKPPRGQWQMVEFDEDFAGELIEFRKVLEMRALVKLMSRDEGHPVWDELRDILSAHKEVKKSFDKRYREVPDLDARLHTAIQSGANNRFIKQFFEVVSFVCHYHYQWKKEGEKERFWVALNEHIDLLVAILAQDVASAVQALEVHLDSAERTLLACATSVNQESEQP